MKKIVILIIILIAILYVSTGRYSTVQLNIERDGWGVLIDEPFWVGGWLMERIGRAKKTTDNWIAQSRMSETEYGKERD